MTGRLGPDHPAATYVPHGYPEQAVDLGEVVLNYAVAGPADAPPLLLVPGQTLSWWTYEPVMRRLEADFRIYAVDLRGQGRSTRTPGRYTLDLWGNDLVRFLQAVVRRPAGGHPALVAGHSSGGVLAAWLAAYAPPGLVGAVYCEDAPFFASEVTPAVGHSIRQTGVGALLQLFATYLGDQWRVGDWAGLVAAAPAALPPWMVDWAPRSAEVPQTLREYDPEWARAFWTGAASAGCDHARMLARARVPVHFTHHFRGIDPATGMLQGAVSDLQVDHARRLVEGAGRTFTCRSFPQTGHAMHADDPDLYAATLRAWARGPAEPGSAEPGPAFRLRA